MHPPRWVIFLIVAVIVAFVASEPERAADVLRAIWDGIVYLFESMVTFFEVVFSGE